MAKFRPLTLTLLMLFIGLLNVNAQDDTPAPVDGVHRYQLHQPDAATFLTNVAKLLPLVPVDLRHAVSSLVQAEMNIRYPDLSQLDPDVLRIGFDALLGIDDYWDERDVWAQAMIVSWLSQHDIDLNEYTSLHIQDFEISVMPRDFSGDGQPEWLLDVQSDHYAQLVVIESASHGYRVVESPLTWTACCLAYNSIYSAAIEEQRFVDMTGDGQPEWIVAMGGSSGNWMSYGRLIILEWQDGHLVDIAPPRDAPHTSMRLAYETPAGGGETPVFPYGVRVTYPDIDGDNTPEIVIEVDQMDNWGCTWTWKRLFRWDSAQFVLTESSRTYEDVQGCEIRAAEESMWAHDVEMAVAHYERAMTLQPTSRYILGDKVEITRYAVARLILAYTLAGRHNEAASLAGQLESSEDDSHTLTAYISAIEDNLGSAPIMCRAAYNVFSFNCPTGTDACLGSPLKAMVGRTLENDGDFPSSPRHIFPAPHKAGCDTAIWVFADLSQSPLAVGQFDPAQLGFPVKEALPFDLNSDGINEWLVWFDLPVPPLWFSASPGDEVYTFTEALLPYAYDFDSPYAIFADGENPYYESAVTFEVRPLPDESGYVIINALERGYDGYQHYCPERRNADGGYSSAPLNVTYTVWHFDGERLKLAAEIPFCAPTTFEAVWGEPNQPIPLTIEGWALVRDASGRSSYQPARYRWISELHGYMATDIQALPDDAEFQEPLTFIELYWQAIDAIEERDYASAVMSIDAALDMRSLQDDEHGIGIYLRALSVEAMGYTDAALNGYMAVYKGWPDSVWSRLAALHLIGDE